MNLKQIAGHLTAVAIIAILSHVAEAWVLAIALAIALLAGVFTIAHLLMRWEVAKWQSYALAYATITLCISQLLAPILVLVTT